VNWSELIAAEIQSAYATADKLASMVDDKALDWKPAAGSNWMTTGQLLKHLTESCGAACRGFVTGDWGFPEGTDLTAIPPAEMLPSIASVAEARRLMEADKRLALEMLASCKESDLAERPAPAPWDPTAMPLGRRLLQMVEHLKQHKGQLFYYLKLQGKPVGTADLWG
jgi:uncharacterized damage-inducible protein DinB